MARWTPSTPRRGAGVLRVHTIPPQPTVVGVFLTEDQVADIVGVKPETLKVWRSRSRRTGHLVGPRWIEAGGAGLPRMIRYRSSDIQSWLESGLVALQPPKKRGRPRKEAVLREGR